MKLSSIRLTMAGSLLLAAITAACTETLDNDAGCPLLCPDQGGEIQTVTLDAITLDSTVSALEGQGTEASLFIATRGDSLDSRAIIRFDSIPALYHKPGPDTTSIPITQVDSAILRMRIDTVGGKIPATLTLDFYDVNSSAPDTATAVIAALFTPDRLITSATFERASLKDTINVPIPSEQILARKGGPMRIGIRARGPESVQLRLWSQEGAGAPTLLTYRVDPDTTISKIVLVPYSKTPETQPILANSLADYSLIVKGTSTGPATQLNIGGLPARRVYMKFDIPAFIIDSVDVVRATLLLTQQPNPSIDQDDTVRIAPQISLAAATVTDIAKAAQIVAVARTDTLKVTPGGSGLRTMEIANVISLWRSQNPVETPRALILVSTLEGTSPLEARFFPVESAPDLRPRLRISYSARKSTGLP
ncbi:MAG TPA: hypothetical protein VJL35_13705 [Gemmatimonadaceae bacterium]|nr:hypothetical protein [Gemmatimonadaceae bacterium]